jgi:hypothetical protein
MFRANPDRHELRNPLTMIDFCPFGSFTTFRACTEHFRFTPDSGHTVAPQRTAASGHEPTFPKTVNYVTHRDAEACYRSQ